MTTAAPEHAADRSAGPAPGRACAGGALWPSALLGALAAACYLLFRQASTHEHDLYWMLPRLATGDLDFPRHPLSLHLAHAWATLLQGFGSLHERLQIASGLSTGFAIAVLTHAAFGLRRERAFAVAVGATFACLPATAHFATVMELHSLFLPFAAAAFWQAVRIAAAPQRASAGAAVALGLTTAIAAAVHATGHLLLGFLGLWLIGAWSQAGAKRSRGVRLGALLVAVHVAASLGLERALVPAETTAATTKLGWMEEWYPTLQDWHRTVLDEWLVPLAPVSLTFLLAWRRHRPLAAAVLLSLPVYLAVCQAMLLVPHAGKVFREVGAYELPLGFGAVALTALVTGPRARLAVLALALLATVGHRRFGVKPPPDPAFGQRAAAFWRAHDVRVLVGDFDQFDGLFEQAYDDPVLRARLSDLLCVPHFLIRSEWSGARTPDELALYLHPSVGGKPCVVTHAALARLRAAGGVYRALVDTALPRLYTLTAVPELTDAPDGTGPAVALAPRRN